MLKIILQQHSIYIVSVS